MVSARINMNCSNTIGTEHMQGGRAAKNEK